MRKIAVLGKYVVQDAIEFARRFQIAAKRFFDDDARIFRATGFLQTFGDLAEIIRRNRQIMQRTLRRAERLLELGVGLRVVVIAVDVGQAFGELAERGFVDFLLLQLRVVLDAVARASTSCSSVHCECETPMIGRSKPSCRDHREQRRENLLVGEIAGSAEENQCVGRRLERRALSMRVFRSSMSESSFPHSTRIRGNDF